MCFSEQSVATCSAGFPSAYGIFGSDSLELVALSPDYVDEQQGRNASIVQRGTDGTDVEEHRCEPSVQATLTDAFKADETQFVVERDGARFRVGHNSDAACRVTLRDGEQEHVSKQLMPDTLTLGSPVHPKASESQYWQRIGWKPAAQTRVRQLAPLQAPHHNGRETNDTIGNQRDVRYRQPELELILPGVVVKEAVERGFAT